MLNSAYSALIYSELALVLAMQMGILNCGNVVCSDENA